MSDLMLDHLRNLVTKISAELQEIGNAHTDNTDKILGALDDMAANVLAMEGVLAAMLKKYPVDEADAKAALRNRLGAEPSETANKLIEYLVSGK